MREYRCCRCNALLFKAEGLGGKVQAACRKCGLVQMIYGAPTPAHATLTAAAA